MTRKHAYAYESGYHDGLESAKFKWHKMVDEQPTDNDARYLLLGNGGGMYVGIISTLRCFDGSTMFHIPNRRDPYMNSSQIKAWAEIPPFEEVKP